MKIARSRFRALLAAAVLAASLSSSCLESAPAGPVPILVPADAIAAVIIESPYKAYAAAEEFWKAAGLADSLGSDLQGLLQKSVPDSSLALQTLDFARPWALAVLPGTGPKKTRQVLYIPYRAKPDDLISKLFGSGSLRLVANAKGYAVLSDAEGELPFPPAKGADLSRLSRYPIASVKLWGDPVAIRRATSDGYKPIHEAIRDFVSAPLTADASGMAGAAAVANDPKAATKALGELGLSLLAQLGLADAALEPGANGIVLRGGSAAKAGSDLQKAITAASFAPSALDWASQVASGSMYGYAWSMDPSIASGLYERMMEPMLSGLGLPKDLAAKASALQAKWAKASGPRGAMSLDMDIDAKAIGAAKDMDSDDPAAVAELVKKMLKIRFDVFQEVKDESAYRAYVKGFAADPDFLAFAKSYGQAFGLSLAIRNQDRKDGSFAYGELAFDIKVQDAAKLGGEGSSKAAEAALSAIGAMTATRWAIANGRFSATSGDVAALKALAARKAADKSLSSDPAFAAFAKTMPAKTVMVGSLSMRKFVGMIVDILAVSGASGSATMPDPASFGSWYSYLAVDARGLSPGIEAGMMIPAADIGALVRSGGALFKGLKSGGGVGGI